MTVLSVHNSFAKNNNFSYSNYLDHVIYLDHAICSILQCAIIALFNERYLFNLLHTIKITLFLARLTL